MAVTINGTTGITFTGGANIDFASPLTLEEGGTGGADAAAARTNLGLVIGTNVQAYDADLDSWSGKTAPTGVVVGDADTQTLTNKTLTTPVITENIQVIGTNTNAQVSTIYVLTASLVLTLPASPNAGDWVSVQNSSGTITSVIDRNGNNIMSLAENLTVDSLNVYVRLIYADATRGWVFG